MVKRRIESLKQQRGNPTQIPGRVMGPILYGPTHPLGSVTTEASLEAITLDDCKHISVTTWLQPGHARLFVVGDLTKEQLEQLFAKSPLAAWKGAAPKPPTLPAPKTMAGQDLLRERADRGAVDGDVPRDGPEAHRARFLREHDHVARCSAAASRAGST